MALAGLLGLRDAGLGEVDAAIVSSVVPTLAHEFEQLIERYLGGRGALVGPGLGRACRSASTARRSSAPTGW